MGFLNFIAVGPRTQKGFIVLCLWGGHQNCGTLQMHISVCIQLFQLVFQ